MRFVIILLLININYVYAQVGINTVSPMVTLHIQGQPTNITLADGVIPPNLTRGELISKNSLYDTDQTGAFVYINSISNLDPSTPKTIRIKSVGYYYFDGEIWQPFSGVPDPIYLPSFNLPLTAIATDVTFDIYTNVYKKQYTKLGNSTFISSNSNLNEIPVVYNANELDYVVTYFDPSILDVKSISNSGILTYDVLDTNPSNSSFINIILVVK
jgi:hypothetical protein